MHLRVLGTTVEPTHKFALSRGTTGPKTMGMQKHRLVLQVGQTADRREGQEN